MTRYGEKLVTAFHTHLDVSSPDISDTAMMVAGLLSPGGAALQQDAAGGQVQ